MPAAWIGAGAAAIGAINSLSSSGGGQVAQGAANIAGGALSAGEAQQFATQVGQIANPFGQYNAAFGAQLAQQSSQNTYLPMQEQGIAALGVQANNSYAQTSNLNAGQIGAQYNNLLQNPDSVYQTQQYQSAFGQGQNAVNSTLAAQGLNASGNQLAALQSFGQSFGQSSYNSQLNNLSTGYQNALAGNQQSFNQMQGAVGADMAYNQQGFNQLAQLSGLSSGSPTAAAAAESNVFGQVNSAGQSIGQGIGQLASGAGSLLNGLNNTSFGSSTSGSENTGAASTSTPDDLISGFSG